MLAMESTPVHGTGTPLRFVLGSIVVGFRGVGALWLAGLALLVLSRGTPKPVIVAATAGGALLWAGVTSLGLREPGMLRSPIWLAMDWAVASWTLLAPAVANEPSGFFGGYPITAVVLAAVVRGYAGGLPAAAVLSAASIASRELGFEDATTSVYIEQVLVFFAAAGVAAWGTATLERNEAARREAERALEAERAERLVAEERSEIAARLHDSVLQTLALIQKRASDTSEVASLARQQERELRRWLFEGASSQGSFRDALRTACSAVEDQHGVKVDVVITGDERDADEHLEALVDAAREAVTNAAKHSGAERVSVYAELAADGVKVFVRDRGIGFDGTPHGHGITNSIIGRLRRHGGTAEVRSQPGKGTEVELVIPT